MGNGRRQCARDLLETAPAVMRFIREQIRRRHAPGFSLPQYRTLSFLGRVKTASLSEAAEHLGLSLPATSRLVNGVVAGRWVARQTVSTNRRQVALTLTRQGRATLEKARDEIRLRLAEALKGLSPAEQRTIRRAMKVLHGVFDAPTAAGIRPRKSKP